MPRTLDRSRRFDTSYGETLMRYHQDGHWFDPQGREVVLVDGVETVLESSPSVAPAAEQPSIVPLQKGAGSATGGAETSEQADLGAQLKAMKTAQVKSIFKAKGGPEELSKGAGAQARMIEWLLANEQAPAAGADGPIGTDGAA